MASDQPSFAKVMGSAKANNEDASFTTLIAEDNDVNIEILKAMLGKFETSIVVAKDGRKAVSFFKSRKIDLILMDISMPTMDGFEAAKEIRAYERVNNMPQTPIIAVTAHVKPGDQHLCIAASMNDYLHKPLKITDLKQAFKIWAPGLSFARPAADGSNVSAA